MSDIAKETILQTNNPKNFAIIICNISDVTIYKSRLPSESSSLIEFLEVARAAIGSPAIKKNPPKPE